MSVLIGISTLLLAALAIAGWVAAVADSAPNLNQRSPEVPGGNSQVFASDGSSLGYIHSTLLRAPVPATQIPTALKHATVAIDARYEAPTECPRGDGQVRIHHSDPGSHSLQGATRDQEQLRL